MGDYWMEQTLEHECYHRELFVLEHDEVAGTVDIACSECGKYWGCVPLNSDVHSPGA